ncbi:MAG: CoA transferase [Chloroflexi bacterium]|nr:CoA transferase [Chloroflexota bacterium]MCL5026441.1 CoA transferase [Chloroflexota bacterium]
MPGPLQGIRVVDLSRALAGPFCSMMLGDLGADVVKVEMPGKGDEARGWGPPFKDGESAYFLSTNRNKRDMTLDLGKPSAAEALWRLVERSDVLLQNFRPGAIDRLGFGYAAVHARNPRLVFCSISGFGQNGPDFQRLAYDPILQGMGGLMSITGQPGGPPTKVGVAIADIVAGMFAAYAILAALYHRERSGEGQYVDTSLLDGQVALLAFQAGRYLIAHEVPEAAGNRHPLLAPSDTFRTGDGYVNIAAGNDAIWARFCRAVGLDALIEDPRFLHNADRVHNVQAMTDLIEERFATMTTDEVVATLDRAQVPAGPIRNIQQVFEDAQVQHLGLRQTVRHSRAGEIEIPGVPYRFSESPAGVHRPPPALGEHTDEVLGELGFTAGEITRMHSEGAV